MERSGIVDWMPPQLTDPRRQQDVVHDLASLIRTTLSNSTRWNGSTGSTTAASSCRSETSPRRGRGVLLCQP